MNNDQNYDSNQHTNAFRSFDEFYNSIIQVIGNKEFIVSDWISFKSLLAIEPTEFEKIHSNLSKIDKLNDGDNNDSKFDDLNGDHYYEANNNNNQDSIDYTNNTDKTYDSLVKDKSSNSSSSGDSNLQKHKLTKKQNGIYLNNGHFSKMHFQKSLSQPTIEASSLDNSNPKPDMQSKKEPITNIPIHSLSSNLNTPKASNSTKNEGNEKSFELFKNLNINEIFLLNKSKLDNDTNNNDIDDFKSARDMNSSSKKSENKTKNIVDKLLVINPYPELPNNHHNDYKANLKYDQYPLSSESNGTDTEIISLYPNKELIINELPSNNITQNTPKSKNNNNACIPAEFKELLLLPGNELSIKTPRSKTNIPYCIIPSLEYISKALNKPNIAISNYASYSNISIVELLNTENTLYTSILLTFFQKIFNDSYSNGSTRISTKNPLINLYEKINTNQIKFIHYHEQDNLINVLLINFKYLMKKLDDNVDSYTIYQAFINKFFHDKIFQLSLIALLKELLIEFINGLDPSIFSIIFPYEQTHAINQLFTNIRSNIYDPTEEIISLIPYIIGNNVEIHYIKENKIEVVLYNINEQILGTTITNINIDSSNPIMLICTKANDNKNMFQIALPNQKSHFFDNASSSTFNLNQLTNNLNDLTKNLNNSTRKFNDDDKLSMNQVTNHNIGEANLNRFETTTLASNNNNNMTLKENNDIIKFNDESVQNIKILTNKIIDDTLFNISNQNLILDSIKNKTQQNEYEYSIDFGTPRNHHINMLNELNQRSEQQIQQKDIGDGLMMIHNHNTPTKNKTPAKISLPNSEKKCLIHENIPSTNNINLLNNDKTTPSKINNCLKYTSNNNNSNHKALNRAHSIPISELDLNLINDGIGFNRMKFLEKCKDLSSFYSRHTQNLLQYFPKELSNHEPLRPNIYPLSNLQNNNIVPVFINNHPHHFQPQCEHESQKYPIPFNNFPEKHITIPIEQINMDIRPNITPTMPFPLPGYFIENKENNTSPISYIPTTTTQIPQYTPKYDQIITNVQNQFPASYYHHAAEHMSSYPSNYPSVYTNYSINTNLIEQQVNPQIESPMMINGYNLYTNPATTSAEANIVNLKVISQPSLSSPSKLINETNFTTQRQYINIGPSFYDIPYNNHQPYQTTYNQVKSPLKKIAVYAHQIKHNNETLDNNNKTNDDIVNYINNASTRYSPYTNRLIIESDYPF